MDYADPVILLNRRLPPRKSFARGGVGAGMKAAAILLAATIASSCSGTTAPSTEATVKIRTVAKGAYAASRNPQPRAVAARDAATFRALWGSLVGSDQIPPIDFSREAAVFLLGGERPTGGYEVAARGASIRGNTLVIDAVVTPPPEGSMTTQALSYPFAVIAVDWRDVLPAEAGATFENVEWRP
jgi:hypothetical protein